MFDTAGFLPLRRSKWQVQPATAATYRKHHEAARMAAFRSLVHFIRPLQASGQACSGGRVGGGGGRLADSWYRCIGGIKQQLSIQQAPKVFRKGWDPRFRHDRIKWELRMIFSDSVTQQFGDPHSIGSKVPYPEFQKLTLRTRDILFLRHGSAFPFCRIQLFVTCRVLASFPILPPPHICRGFEVRLPPPPSALLGPRPL